MVRQVANRVYTFDVKAGDRDFQWIGEPLLRVAWGWDAPKADDGILVVVESQRGHDARDSGPVEGKSGTA